MERKIVYKAILIALFIIIASNIYAYQLSPLSVSYSTSGADSTKAYTITNDSDSPIAIEMKVYKRFVSESGEEYTELSPEYFSVQPSKMIIKPQSSQIVRVQYRGPRTVTKEMSFRIVSEQIAYSKGAALQQGSQMINFLFVYSTAAYVKPSRVIENVTGSARLLDDGKLEIVIENTGSVHQILEGLSVGVKSGSYTYTLTKEELEGLDGINLLTDSRLVKTIECPAGLVGKTNYSVDLDYNFSY